MRRPWHRDRSGRREDLPSVFELLRRAGLLQRVRLCERFALHARVEDTHHRRYRRDVAVEEPGAENLRRETDVRDAWRIAVAVAAGLAVAREVRFHRLKARHDPVLAPARACGLVHGELLLEV